MDENGRPKGVARGEAAAGWSDDSGWNWADVTYAADPRGRHGRAQRVDIRTPAEPGKSAFVQMAHWSSLKDQTRYVFRVWARAAAGAAAPMTVTASLRLRDAPYTIYASQQVRVGRDWTPVQISGRVAGGAGGVLLQVYEAGTLWLDDAQLTGVPAPLATPRAPIPLTYFGMHLLNVAGTYGAPPTPWPAPPPRIGTLRLHDSGVFWRDVEPERGRFDWARLDAAVRRAGENGAEVVYVLGQTPAWAAARTGEPNFYGDGSPSEPARIEDWERYVRAVAGRYKSGSPHGRIRNFELWNEPNDPKYFSGSLASMKQMAQVAHRAVKGADPQNRLVSPGTSVDLNWLGRFLDSGTAPLFDVIGYHPYSGAPEEQAALLGNARDMLDARGLRGRPLWNTESGWFNSGGQIRPPEKEAGYIARALLLNWAAGAERFLHYKWERDERSPEQGIGVLFLAPDHKTLLPAGVAYGTVQGWLAGATMTSVTQDARGNWVLALTRRGGRKAWAVWNPATPAPLAVPRSWGATHRQDLTGASAAFAGGTITAGPAPVLLEAVPPAAAVPPGWRPAPKR
jgi:hypothetical protein